MKKFAIKGLVTLVVIVLLCIFFSGTLHTITTAKARMTKAKSGYFETVITMNGSLAWPETVDLKVGGMTGEDTLVIRRMAVSAGSYVREGDLIAECEVSNADSRLETMQSNYTAREKEYLELERKNSNLLLTDQQREWFSAYHRLQEAMNAAQNLRQDLRLEAWKADVSLQDHDTLPEDVNEESLTALRDRLTEAEREEEDARAAFDQLKWLTIPDETVSYLDKKEEYEKEMEKLTADMTNLRILQVKAAAIVAPHDGYVATVDLKVGDQVSQNTVLVTMTAPGTAPVIRLDPGDNRRTIPVDTPVTLSVGDASVESVICAQGVKPEGGYYLDAALTQANLTALGGSTAVSEANAVNAKITWKAETASTLIPSSAVRGSEGAYYLYVAVSSVNALGAERMNVERKDINVLGMSDSVASVAESLKNDTIVYMEDRSLTEGCEVMQY